MVIKQLPLRVLIRVAVYKAIMVKIEAYEESVKRFERLHNSTNAEGCKAL